MSSGIQSHDQSNSMEQKINSTRVLKRQVIMIGVFLALMSAVICWLVIRDRQQERMVREEQARHRLGLAKELFEKDVARVRSDLLFLAQQDLIKRFAANPKSGTIKRTVIENEFANFLATQKFYQQVRLIDLSGQEKIRVDYKNQQVDIVEQQQLQDKSDRYYVKRSIRLEPGQVFVSEFDLNQERGKIESPVVPVIRFVTPVSFDATAGAQVDLSNPDESHARKAKQLLVINYLGGPLLQDLSNISLPGTTLLVRQDGQYLLGPNPDDAWGWLLGHSRSFDQQFSQAWKQRRAANDNLVLTNGGAFCFRKLGMQQLANPSPDDIQNNSDLWAVSYLPANEVYANSNRLLQRLLIFTAIMLIPLVLLTRVWSAGIERRNLQHQLILQSEKQLRKLSRRLLRIQEKERKSISREIHDHLGQQVTAINLDLKMARRKLQSQRADESLSVNELDRLISESEQLLESLHHFAKRIRPAELDDLGLHDALESYIWEFRQRSGVETEFHYGVSNLELRPEVEENVFRIIQEALNNVLKHANAKHVNVRIDCNDGQNLRVQVSDDGVASELAEDSIGSAANKQRSSGLGILGMKERVDLLGGDLQIQLPSDASDSHNGTKLTISVPLLPRSTEAADET